MLFMRYLNSDRTVQYSSAAMEMLDGLAAQAMI